MDDEDEIRNMSNKELHEKCMTFFFEITNRKDKPVLLTAEEKDKAEAAKQEMDAITKAQVSVNSKIAECSKGFLLR